jgi:hypothetical protein
VSPALEVRAKKIVERKDDKISEGNGQEKEHCLVRDDFYKCEDLENIRYKNSELNRFYGFSIKDSINASGAHRTMKICFNDKFMIVEIAEGHRDQQIINVYDYGG